jgi:hypothetical protein
LAWKRTKATFGTYPTVDVAGTGFAVLGKAMIGPYGDGLAGTNVDDLDPPRYDAAKPISPAIASSPASNNGSDSYVALAENTGQQPPNPLYWAQLDVHDFHDGPGFKVRAGGKVSGPYLAAGKFKTQGLAIVDITRQPDPLLPGQPPGRSTCDGEHVLRELCRHGHDASTRDARRERVHVQVRRQRVTASALTNDPGHEPAKALARMQAMMGAVRNMCTGTAPMGNLATPRRVAAYHGPYILWSCGPDGRFGPDSRPHAIGRLQGS